MVNRRIGTLSKGDKTQTHTSPRVLIAQGHSIVFGSQLLQWKPDARRVVMCLKPVSSVTSMIVIDQLLVTTDEV